MRTIAVNSCSRHAVQRHQCPAVLVYCHGRHGTHIAQVTHAACGMLALCGVCDAMCLLGSDPGFLGSCSVRCASVEVCVSVFCCHVSAGSALTVSDP